MESRENFPMFRRTLLVLFAVVAGIGAMPGKTRAAEAQTAHQLHRTLTKAADYKYLLALPDGLDAKADRRWPLLLFLHGAGERGDDVWAVTKHGPAKLLRYRDETKDDAANLLAKNFIVVSPQCPKNQWWDPECLLALLDEIVATQPVDPTRVYLTGISMGGFGAWDLGLAYPERFAAIVPICGGGQFATAYLANAHKRAELRSLAVWAFHGGKDPTVPLVESERMVAALKKYQVAEVELTIYPEATHDSWTQTYANPDLYTWLLRHRRPSSGKAK